MSFFQVITTISFFFSLLNIQAICDAQSFGTCTSNADCSATVRSRYPSESLAGVDMCQCYAASSMNPFDECEGETDETCAIAKCVNSCENSEAYCDNPQEDSGLCLLRPLDKPVNISSISNNETIIPACSSSFTTASCPVYVVPQNITITSITNDTACLNACIECQGPTWGCTAKFGKYSYMNKSMDDFTTAYSYKCSCEVGPRCGNGSENYTDLCMDVGYKSSSASKSILIGIRGSMMLGVVSLWVLLL